MVLIGVGRGVGVVAGVGVAELSLSVPQAVRLRMIRMMAVRGGLCFMF